MNPITATLIVRDDPHLSETVACLRPHVAEIAIAHTPCDAMPEAAVRALCDRYVIVPGIEDGRIFDWSAARNAAMALATQPFVLWADTDDTVRGLEHLPEVLERLRARPRSRVLCPYEYMRDKQTGDVTHLQWRERIVTNDGRYHWIRPCHETLVARDGQYDHPEIREERIVWEHHREDQPDESGRALRMLLAYEAAHPDDPWVMLNLGLEQGRSGNHDAAARYLERYVQASGWDDERAFAMVQLADECFAAAGFGKDADWTRAEAWARRARELRPDWFEPHFALARLAMARAMLRGEDAALREVAQHCESARNAPPASHPLPVRPDHRAVHVHEVERVACETMSDWRGALAATERQMAGRPVDGMLRMAKRRYEAAIRLEEIEKHASAAATQDFLVLTHDVERALLREPAQSLSIIFACGSSWSEWNPAVLAERGLGGSETAVIEMARRLAAKGHRVRVYCTSGGPGIYDGVEYRDAASVTERPKCDVLVAWRNAPLVEFAEAHAAALWVHDVTAANMAPRYAVQCQRVLALSEWHRRNLLEKHHELSAGQVHVTRNGIDLARFATSATCGRCHGKNYESAPCPDGREGCLVAHARPCSECGGDAAPKRDPHRAIYSSSADRGLQVLLDVWPQIRERVPDATLTVAYGMDLWKAVADQSGSEQQRYAAHSLERRLRSTPGVSYIGQVDQQRLAREMLASGVWCGSLWFPETSCIGAMEAQAAGLRCVAGAKAALLETIGERGTLIDGDWMSDGYQRRLVDAVVAAMTREGDDDRLALQAYARERFSWDGVAGEWEALFAELLREAEDGVMPEFPERRVA